MLHPWLSACPRPSHPHHLLHQILFLVPSQPPVRKPRHNHKRLGWVRGGSSSLTWVAASFPPDSEAIVRSSGTTHTHLASTSPPPLFRPLTLGIEAQARRRLGFRFPSPRVYHFRFAEAWKAKQERGVWALLGLADHAEPSLTLPNSIGARTRAPCALGPPSTRVGGPPCRSDRFGFRISKPARWSAKQNSPADCAGQQRKRSRFALNIHGVSLPKLSFFEDVW